jgi:hypothetical protein
MKNNINILYICVYTFALDSREYNLGGRIKKSHNILKKT